MALEFDYSGAKNETAAKKQAREDLTAILLDFLKQRFGEENVDLVDKNTIGFAFGTVIDKDGYTIDMIATVKPVIKNYQVHAGKNGDIDPFDFDEARKEYKDLYEGK